MGAVVVVGQQGQEVVKSGDVTYSYINSYHVFLTFTTGAYHDCRPTMTTPKSRKKILKGSCVKLQKEQMHYRFIDYTKRKTK